MDTKALARTDLPFQIWGRNANMNLVGYDWAPFGVDKQPLKMKKRFGMFLIQVLMSGSKGHQLFVKV